MKTSISFSVKYTDNLKTPLSLCEIEISSSAVSISTYSVGISNMGSVKVLGRLAFQLSFTQIKNRHSLKLDFCTLAFSEIRQEYFVEITERFQRIS